MSDGAGTVLDVRDLRRLPKITDSDGPIAMRRFDIGLRQKGFPHGLICATRFA